MKSVVNYEDYKSNLVLGTTIQMFQSKTTHGERTLFSVFVYLLHLCTTHKRVIFLQE